MDIFTIQHKLQNSCIQFDIDCATYPSHTINITYIHPLYSTSVETPMIPLHNKIMGTAPGFRNQDVRLRFSIIYEIWCFFEGSILQMSFKPLTNCICIVV